MDAHAATIRVAVLAPGAERPEEWQLTNELRAVSGPEAAAGMDAHAATIRVAVLAPGAERPEEWQLTNELRAVKRLAQRLKRMAPGPVVAYYEAGPGGFALQRQLEAEGIECRVIAPALIPRRPGDRVKTDRRDARKLAELLRTDLLTAVHPPTIDQEAVRDLCRAREDAVTDRTRARHRLGKLLLRRGIAYDGRNWTLRHRRGASITLNGGAKPGGAKPGRGVGERETIISRLRGLGSRSDDPTRGDRACDTRGLVAGAARSFCDRPRPQSRSFRGSLKRKSHS